MNSRAVGTARHRSNWTWPFSWNSSGDTGGNPAAVRVETIGRPCSGKTAMFDTIYKAVFQGMQPSDLQIGLGDPRRVTALINELKEKYDWMRKQGLPSTFDPRVIEYRLFEGDAEMARLELREVIGQIISRTTEASPPEQQAQYEEYLTHLSEADVLWVVVPSPPAQASGVDKDRYRDDLDQMTAYLVEALRRRQDARPCAVALVLSKGDILFPSAAEARAKLSDDRLIDLLGPLVTPVRKSPRVSDAAAFVVSAYGFGNTKIRQTVAVNGVARTEEPTYILKDGRSPEPFNLSTLVFWSLLAGLLNHEVSESDDREPELARVCRLLSGDIEAQGGWGVVLKGQLLSR